MWCGSQGLGRDGVCSLPLPRSELGALTPGLPGAAVWEQGLNVLIVGPFWGAGHAAGAVAVLFNFIILRDE